MGRSSLNSKSGGWQQVCGEREVFWGLLQKLRKRVAVCHCQVPSLGVKKQLQAELEP